MSEPRWFFLALPLNSAEQFGRDFSQGYRDFSTVPPSKRTGAPVDSRPSLVVARQLQLGQRREYQQWLCAVVEREHN